MLAQLAPLPWSHLDSQFGVFCGGCGRAQMFVSRSFYSPHFVSADEVL